MASLYYSAFGLLLFIWTSGVSCQNARPYPCTVPPIVSNANHSVPGHTDGSVVVYTCNTNFEAVGSAQKTCRDGVWVSGGANLTCKAITCSRPPQINNGYHGNYFIFRSSYPVGETVSYRCQYGYFINGSNAELTCLANRTWSLPTPRCDAQDCGPPPEMSAANVSYINTKAFTTATYACDTGYHIDSSGASRTASVITCSALGHWSNPALCKPKDCGLPSTVKNGVRFTQGNHLYRQKVTYECDHGYVLEGDNEVMCEATGRWSALPSCQKMQCGKQMDVGNATFHPVQIGFFGDITTYICAKGFETIGSPLVHCQSDGTWTQLPVCSLVDCRTPPAIHFGVHTWNSTTYDSKTEYKCDEGYKLIGVPEIHCLSDGRWSDAPACEIPPGVTPPQPSSRKSQIAETNTSDVTGLAIACAVMAALALLSIAAIAYKQFIAPRLGGQWSFSFKKGDDTANII